MRNMEMDTNSTCTVCSKKYYAGKLPSRFCPECREINTKKVKARSWLKKHPEDKRALEQYLSDSKKRSAVVESRRSVMEDAVKHISKTVKPVSASWEFDFPKPDFNEIYTFCIPFNKDLSKNSMKAWGNGRYFKTNGFRNAQKEIVYKVKNSGLKLNNSKVYLSIFVEKPDNRGDAINYVDGIADAIVVATGVDDRWYSLDRLDWQINKNNPKIWITIKQDTKTYRQACSHCGRILEINAFQKNKSTKTGHSRVCYDCRRARDREFK